MALEACACDGSGRARRGAASKAAACPAAKGGTRRSISVRRRLGEAETVWRRGAAPSVRCDAVADRLRPHGGRRFQAWVLGEDLGVAVLEPVDGLKAEFLVEPRAQPVEQVQQVAV